MRADSPQRRSEGFYHLFAAEEPGGLEGRSAKIPSLLSQLFRDVPDRAEDVTATLVTLLSRENAYSRTAKRTSEEFTSYRGDLVFAVASLGDKRALAPLLEVLASGRLATNGVARLGATAALGALLTRATAPSDPTRNGATRTLGFLLDPTINPEPLTPGQRADIKSALTRATGDASPFIRISAIDGLSRLPDPDVTRLLRQIADTDPYTRPPGSLDTGFPVREAAKRALAARTGAP
jgi:HEAT repeat protein